MEDIYVISFSYTEPPKDTARLRIQIYSAHDNANLDKVALTFEKAKPCNSE
jgi:7-keto-8-aminopelargonate synthetase-like enzyme